MKKEASKKLKRTLQFFSLTAIAISLIVNTPKITGNVISETTFGTFSFLGTTLLILGIVGIILTRK